MRFLTWLIALAIPLTLVQRLPAQTTEGFSLRLEKQPQDFDLFVPSLNEPGALFLYRSFDIKSPVLMLQTNAPLPDGLLLRVGPEGKNQSYFNAAFWPGRSIDEFGDPEYHEEEPPPAMILLASGVPEPLVADQPIVVNFFITDAAGNLLDLSGPVGIFVMDGAGAIHPDAQVSPASGQMAGGHLRVEINIMASTSLAGYTIGLGPTSPPASPSPQASIASATSSEWLPDNLPPSSTVPTLEEDIESMKEADEQKRKDNRDPNLAWDFPLRATPSDIEVSGTFGEWRGGVNRHVHKGLDLAAGVNTHVIASRGGTLRHIYKGGKGYYIVIDHGDGYFTRYLHLDGSSIPGTPNANPVVVNHKVQRGDVLATKLYSEGGFPVHLHFEIRKGPDLPHWGDKDPGEGLDPLQAPNVNFTVRLGSPTPNVEEIGITHGHPAKTPFVKATSAIPDGTGKPVYFVARCVDEQPTVNLTKKPRLALRSMSFRPEGPTPLNWIWPSDEAAIAGYHPNSQNPNKGFALYKAVPTPRDHWYLYWWKWDTSAYKTQPGGPRIVTLDGLAYDGRTTIYALTFGPQIKNLEASSVQGQFAFTIVANLGTNTVSLSQPDRYKIELIQADGKPLAGVEWGSSIETNPTYGLTPVVSNHHQEDGYTFTLPVGASSEGLKLRVSSRMVPDMAHELLLKGCPPGPVTLGPNMVLIPAGSFTMGDTFGEGNSWELPLHSVYVSAFYMDKYEVTKALWDEVYQWAIGHGYSFDSAGSGKAANHPVHTINWYDMVKWCNARSEMDGRDPAYYTSAGQTTVYRSGQVTLQNDWVKWCTGYRLPTEAEWEKAARGGASGRRFPWSDSDTITHSRANYISYSGDSSGASYDVSPTTFYHPTFNDGVSPYSNPVDYFTPNEYGLYDMAGNMEECCWDWYGSYSGGSQTDPRGPAAGSNRVIRGGSWLDSAKYCRAADRIYSYNPTRRDYIKGFRSVLSAGQ